MKARVHRVFPLGAGLLGSILAVACHIQPPPCDGVQEALYAYDVDLANNALDESGTFYIEQTASYDLLTAYFQLDSTAGALLDVAPALDNVSYDEGACADGVGFATLLSAELSLTLMDSQQQVYEYTCEVFSIPFSNQQLDCLPACDDADNTFCQPFTWVAFAQ